MDANSLFIGMFAGAIGMGYFVYGKKQSKPVPLVTGLALMIYPWFFTNIWLLLAVGLILCIVPIFVKIEM